MAQKDIEAKFSNRVSKWFDQKFDIAGISMICCIRFNNRISKIRQNKKDMAILSHGIQPNYQLEKWNFDNPDSRSNRLKIWLGVLNNSNSRLWKVFPRKRTVHLEYWRHETMSQTWFNAVDNLKWHIAYMIETISYSLYHIVYII